MANRPKISFFTDHNIPDSVGDYLRNRGHSVFRLRHHLADDSPDPIVATAALRAGRVLVSWDKDFNTQRFMQPRFALLSRLALSGAGPELLPALKQHMHLIEFQWSWGVRTHAPRMIAHIRLGQIKFKD